MQDDLICAWAVKGSTLKDWRSLSLYVNADGRETGRIEGYPGQKNFWRFLDRIMAADAPLPAG